MANQNDVLKMVASQTEQLKLTFDLELKLAKPANIVLSGMGGSALAAEFMRTWLSDELKVPFVINRNYSFPAFVDENTLVIISSYSGNTEETLSALKDAQKRSGQIVIMTAGGKLQEIAEREQYPVLKLPGDWQPRMTTFAQMKALSRLLEELNLAKGLSEELASYADWLEKESTDWQGGSGQAKQLAEKLKGHPIVVYGSNFLAAAVLKWKIGFNENAKNQAFYFVWPEFNHNEFQGWLNPKGSNLAVVELQSDLDNGQIEKRFEVSNKLLEGIWPEPNVVKVKGETQIQQLLWAALLGEMVSVQLAYLNGVDPIPVDLVEQLKKEL